ncbi:MAG: hypothetical protein HYU27_03665 [Acidobacteria bacterium]|nr:hypothetical protein [Acidobacteriota bacterium]
MKHHQMDRRTILKCAGAFASAVLWPGVLFPQAPKLPVTGIELTTAH